MSEPRAPAEGRGTVNHERSAMWQIGAPAEGRGTVNR
jgi:hypothetical protein